MTIAEKIYEIRGAMSLREFAKVTDISFSHIRKLEGSTVHEQKAHSLEMLKQICDRSGYPFKKFLEETGYIESDTPLTLNMVDERSPYDIIQDNIHKLSKDELVMLEALVRYARRDRE